MSEEDARSHRPDAPSEATTKERTKESGPNPLEKREQRRDDRTKNTLVWRELAIIAALGIVILAFNLSWGSPEGNQDMAAQQREEIRLRDVRPTPPEPEPPEPEPEPEPQPQVQKNQQRKEVPDEQVEESPETSAEPVNIQDLNTDTETSSEPAPQSNPNANPTPDPSPPANKVFSKGTADQNAQMKGGPISPEYPPEAKRAGIQGQVVLKFVVDESGRPQGITVLRSPHDALAEAAVSALEEKRFTPARQNGEPVKMRMSQPVAFRLQ
jgi:protein TonB